MTASDSRHPKAGGDLHLLVTTDANNTVAKHHHQHISAEGASHHTLCILRNFAGKKHLNLQPSFLDGTHRVPHDVNHGTRKRAVTGTVRWVFSAPGDANPRETSAYAV